MGPLSTRAAAAADAPAQRPPVQSPTPGQDQATEAPRFLLLDSGTPQDAAFASATSDHARSVQLDLQVIPIEEASPLAQAIAAANEPGTTGVFWLGRRPDAVAIYLYEPRDQGVYIREVARAEGESDAALVESVGLIIASTAAALRERGEIGMRRVDDDELAELEPAAPEPAEPVQTAPPVEPTGPPTVEDEPEPEEEPAKGLGIRLGVGYVGDGFNRSAPWQSGARGELALVAQRWLRLGIEYAFLAPARVSDTPRLDVTRHSLGLSLGLGRDMSTRVHLHGAVLGVVDLVRWRGPLGAGLRPMVRLGPMLEVSITLVRGFALDVGVGATLPINRFAFVVCPNGGQACTGEDREIAARAWAVTPRATAGFSYTFEPRRRP